MRPLRARAAAKANGAKWVVDAERASLIGTNRQEVCGKVKTNVVYRAGVESLKLRGLGHNRQSTRSLRGEAHMRRVSVAWAKPPAAASTGNME